jgi:hypothetical protein
LFRILDMSDYYSKTDAGLIPWHNTFETETTNYAPVLSSVLTAGILTQIGVNRDMVEMVVNAADEAKNYASEMVAYKDAILRAPANSPLPAPPTIPAALVIPPGAMAAIEAWTRALVAQIKAHPAYTEAIGEAMGITAKVSSPGTPTVVATALTQSQVSLAIAENGATLVAIDSRIGNGAWSELVRVSNTPYIAMRPPQVAGQAEFREYRVQAVVNNARVGAYSPVSGTWTVP